MTLASLLSAMILVESGGNPNVVGDSGRSVGPLQIQRAYWQDSGVPGTYQQCRDVAYAKRVVIAYWKRYAPRELARVQAGRGSVSDFATLARIHNGGPRGHTKRATLGYWNKVKSVH